MKLTGKIRYRQLDRCFGKTLLVLQVQEKVEVFNRPDYYIDSWRDATIDDLEPDVICLKWREK